MVYNWSTGNSWQSHFPIFLDGWIQTMYVNETEILLFVVKLIYYSRTEMCQCIAKTKDNWLFQYFQRGLYKGIASLILRTAIRF